MCESDMLMRHTVQNAKLLGTVKIVTYDWLEDSLLAANRKPKIEKPYLLENLMKLETSRKSQKKTAQSVPNKVSKDSRKEKSSVASKRPIGIVAGITGEVAIYVPC